MSELLTPMQAARVAGVSYPTIKQWIYRGKIQTTKLPAGIIGFPGVRSSVLPVAAPPPKQSAANRLVWMRLAGATSCAGRSLNFVSKACWSR
jgi:hypothetical protein